MINKKDLKEKLSKLLDLDSVEEIADYDLDDDFILWGECLKDSEGTFIHGEIISRDDDGFWSDVMFGFAYTKKDDLNELSDYIIKQIDNIMNET